MLTEQVLWTIGVCPVGEELWFSSAEFNGLFRADMRTGQAAFVSPISACDKTQKFGFSCIVQIENFLYLCPFSANCICRYDIQNNKMQFWPLELEMAPCVNRAYCFYDRIYMFCDKLHLIIVFDSKTEEISYIHEEPDRKYNFDKVCDIVCIGEFLYFAKGRHIIETDLWFRYISEYSISGYSEENIATLAYHEGNFWMLCGEEKLISWNKKQNKACVYSVAKRGAAFRSLISGNSLYILYPDTNYILITDLESRNTVRVHRREFGSQDGNRKVFLPFLKKNIKGIFAYSYINSGIHHIKPNGEVESVPLYMDNLEQFLTDYMRSGFYAENSLFYEENTYLQSLDFFLNCIGGKCEKEKSQISNIGSVIYNEIKESKGMNNDIV